MGALTFKTTLQKRGPASAVVLDDDEVNEVREGADARAGDAVEVTLEMLHAGKTIS
ncbi:MAG: hypothetical protein ACLP4R_10220 [Solirubrobacteraceae bacterium]